MSFFDAANASASSSSEDEDEETETETETETRERVEVVEEASSHRRGMNDFEHHSVPRASDVLAALDDGASACGVSALVARRRVRPDMASAVEASMEDRAGNSYYGGGGGGTKRTDGEEEEEYDRRAATIRVDARKIRFVEHRVAVRLTSSEGNGVGESVRATGARVAVDDDVVDDTDHPVDDREERRVSIVGPPECVQRCVELIEALVRETKNQTSKKFYCPRAFLGAFLGRGRGNAKKIEGVSKCKIVIADVDKVHEGNEHAVVRAIEVTGTPAQVSLGYKLALQNLDEALKTTPGADVDWVKAELKDATGFDVDDERARVKRRKEMADR